MSFGNMANDGGSLQLREAQVIDTIQNHFFDKRFIRLFLGSEKYNKDRLETKKVFRSAILETGFSSARLEFSYQR